MSTPRFEVGQRVRIIRSRKSPERVGTITTIAGYVPAGETADGRDSWKVDLPPSATVRAKFPRQRHARYRAQDLEPIGDSDQPASWTDCVWKPEGIRA